MIVHGELFPLLHAETCSWSAAPHEHALIPFTHCTYSHTPTAPSTTALQHTLLTHSLIHSFTHSLLPHFLIHSVTPTRLDCLLFVTSDCPATTTHKLSHIHVCRGPCVSEWVSERVRCRPSAGAQMVAAPSLKMTPLTPPVAMALVAMALCRVSFNPIRVSRPLTPHLHPTPLTHTLTHTLTHLY
jgi:hypothetical protein